MRYETFWTAASDRPPRFESADLTASLNLYVRIVKPALEAVFPGAEVKATWLGGKDNPRIEVEVTWGPGGQPEDQLIAFGKRVSEVAKRIWKEGRWIVPVKIDAKETKSYRAPDRSRPAVNFDPQRGDVDLGWSAGALRDGRPYKVESWLRGDIKSWTFFISTQGIEHYTDDDFKALLTREGLVKFTGERCFLQAVKILDDRDEEVWSVNLVVGDAQNTFAAETLLFRPYTAGDGLHESHRDLGANGATPDLALAEAAPRQKARLAASKPSDPLPDRREETRSTCALRWHHAVIIAAGLALGGLLSGGIYETHHNDNAARVWRANRLTGAVDVWDPKLPLTWMRIPNDVDMNFAEKIKKAQEAGSAKQP